jgi:hypothetical protein
MLNPLRNRQLTDELVGTDRCWAPLPGPPRAGVFPNRDAPPDRAGSVQFTFPDRAGRADYRTEERRGTVFGARCWTGVRLVTDPPYNRIVMF